MRIALYHNLPSGGAKRMTYGFVEGLAERGHDVHEFTQSTADLDFSALPPYIKSRSIAKSKTILPIGKRRIPFLTPYLHSLQGIATLSWLDYASREIAQTIDETDFDIAFVNDCCLVGNPYVLRYLKTPSVFYCNHGLGHRTERAQADGNKNTSRVEQLKALYYQPARYLFQNKLALDEKQNAKAASLILTNSKFSERLLHDHYGVPSGVVYPGIDTNIFRYQPLEKQDYVLCVAALVYRKGYRFLVSSLARIPANRRPRLFIAANMQSAAEAEAVRDMAARLGVELHIEQITDDQRLVQVYNQALAFVYAPIKEALGLAPLEAMACGTPVVAVGEGGVRETVVDGVNGMLVERDSQAFAEALQRLLYHQSQRERMGQAGIEYVRTRWTWDTAIDNLERHFRQLVGMETTC